MNVFVKGIRISVLLMTALTGWAQSDVDDIDNIVQRGGALTIKVSDFSGHVINLAWWHRNTVAALLIAQFRWRRKGESMVGYAYVWVRRTTTRF